LAGLEAEADGLSGAAAQARLERHGPNRIAPAKRESLFSRLGRQFHSLLIYVLLASAVAALVMGEWVDCLVILAVVGLNAVIGLVQEGKAEEALAAVARLMALAARVRRDGLVRMISAEEVVPGDRIELAAGDRVPADLRVLSVRDLEIDEAALTGESLPVAKGIEALPEATPLAERANMAYAGTLVVRGRGHGVAVETGEATEVGRIGRLARQAERPVTPLILRMDAFGRRLAVAIVLVAVAIFLYGGLVRGEPWEAMFMAAVGLAVAAIPEGLPAVLSIAMAVGVARMAKRQALIRRLPAVETLGAASVIGTDKTGTLTVGVMAAGEFHPAPGLTADDLRRAALLASETETALAGGAMAGGATEQALVRAAIESGLDPAGERQRHPVLETLPFDSARQWNAVRLAEGVRLVKGAPERVLALCAPSPVDWAKAIESLAGRGQRVIALAQGPAKHDRTLDATDQPALAMLGLIGLADPPRPEAIAAVAQCQAAGIRVIMITGDHARTARAIAERFGLVDHGMVVEGPELDRLDPQALADQLDRIAVVARATPEHKLRLVQALQAKGAVVAMTGDGVNDAPALKQASIGVAMGKSGTEAAKEAAVMVLADDNFATLAHAVEEGRAVYDAIVKSLAYILPTNAAQALILILAVLAGFPLPITPVQILWVNLVTSVTLGMALAFAPGEPDLMNRPPRDPQAPLLTRALIVKMAWTASLMTALSIALFQWEMGRSGDLALARTLAVNGLVAAEIGYLFAVRSFTRPAWTIDRRPGAEAVWIAVAAMIALQVGFTHLGAMGAFFDTRPMDGPHWLLTAAAGLAVLVLVEAEKFARRVWPETSSGGR